MRLLIALVAVLALLVNPVVAAAAMVACQDADAVMTPMDQTGTVMAAMPGMAKADTVDQASSDPCCDHSKSNKMGGKPCAQACATTCAVLTALPLSSLGKTLFYARAPISTASFVWPPAFNPSGLDRPPKSMA